MHFPKLNFTPFARAAFRRAVKTMAQTASSLIGVGAVMSDINWKYVVSASLLSGIMSVLTSVATDLPEAPAAVPLPANVTGGDAQ